MQVATSSHLPCFNTRLLKQCRVHSRLYVRLGLQRKCSKVQALSIEGEQADGSFVPSTSGQQQTGNSQAQSTRSGANTSSSTQNAPPSNLKRLPMPPNVRDIDQWAMYVDEYSQLKETLLSRTRQAGAAMALYALFALDGKGSLCTLMGTSFAYVYLLWLFYDIDTLNYANPGLRSERGRFSIFSVLVKAFLAYAQALKPRLLVPISAAALFATINAKIGAVPLIYEGCLLAGFLAYKFALLTLLLDELQLKRAEDEEEYRPSLATPVDDELDVYGRPKPQVASPIDALPPDMQAAAESELAKTVTKKLESS